MLKSFVKRNKTTFRYIQVTVCVLATAMLFGCAALGTRIIHSEPFAGVKTDYAECFHRDGISPECRINPIFAVIDAPFSLVVDLVYLPFEIGHHAGHSLSHPPSIERNQGSITSNVPTQSSQGIGAFTPQPEEVILPKAMSCVDPAFYETYVIKKGDTLWSIAKRFQDRDTLELIIYRNRIINSERIYPGQTIFIQNPRE